MAQSFQLSTIRNKRVKWRSRGIEKSLFSPLSHLTNNRRSLDTWELECSWPIDRGWSCNRNSSSSSSPDGWTFWSSEHFWTGDPPRRPQFSLIRVQLLFPMFYCIALRVPCNLDAWIFRMACFSFSDLTFAKPSLPRLLQNFKASPWESLRSTYW